ncbi:hypothetical protein PQX77_011894 [Marasmius sp. AFHP31]|nr:hypothetical protein PQX77_011894 [Marasmius sp. AFHP31]
MRNTKQAPASSDDVTGLEFVTTVTNTRDETLKLLKHPNSVLSKWATDSFEVYNGDGIAADFNGVIARYNPELAVKSKDASVFTVLTPDASVEITHEVGNFYNFTNAGPGAFTFKPSNIFLAVELDGSLTTIEVSVDGVETKLTGKLASSQFVSSASAGGATLGTPFGHQKRAIYRSNCTPDCQTVNNDALPGATLLAKNATTWYGTFARPRYDVTVMAFNSLLAASASWTYDCSCTDRMIPAYIHKDPDLAQIVLFTRVPTSRKFWIRVIVPTVRPTARI